MLGPAQPPSSAHAARQTFWPATLLAAAAIASWSSLWWLEGPSHLGAMVLASTLTTISFMRPWCRQHTLRAIVTATWAADREREHALSTAAEHVEAWRAIVDTATEGIITIDAQGTIGTVNGAAERQFGYAPQALIGQNVNILMPQPFQGLHDEYLARYLRTGERKIIGIGREVVGLRKDGSSFPIDLSVGEGAIEGRSFFTAVIRDISERRELQTKLAQAERLAAVGELAAGVAHEINNPINTMINCAQLIQDGDEAGENGRIIIEEGGRIADIVSALLQFARDDNDQAQPTSISEVVQRTLRLLGENWKRHGITLTINVADNLPAVHARPQKVQQVLLNLMMNAKDALLLHDGKNRYVSLDAAIAGDGVEFSVSDSGPGIDESVRDRIFEPFVTTKRARGGTGLGLSISRSIIEGYGGTLRLEDPDGEGSVFSVWLPQAPED